MSGEIKITKWHKSGAIRLYDDTMLALRATIEARDAEISRLNKALNQEVIDRDLARRERGGFENRFHERIRLDSERYVEWLEMKIQRDTALTRIKELGAQVGEAVKALTRIKCECRYRPYSHQYVFKCDRCEVLARLSKPAESGERGMG